MSDPGQSPPAGREFVFRTIQRLMLIDVVGGAVLALLALFVLDFPALAIAGALLAFMGLGLSSCCSERERAAPARRPGRAAPHELRR
jgi:hypothetical protein